MNGWLIGLIIVLYAGIFWGAWLHAFQRLKKRWEDTVFEGAEGIVSFFIALVWPVSLVAALTYLFLRHVGRKLA